MNLSFYHHIKINFSNYIYVYYNIKQFTNKKSQNNMGKVLNFTWSYSCIISFDPKLIQSNYLHYLQFSGMTRTCRQDAETLMIRCILTSSAGTRACIDPPRKQVFGHLFLGRRTLGLTNFFYCQVRLRMIYKIMCLFNVIKENCHKNKIIFLLRENNQIKKVFRCSNCMSIYQSSRI